MTDDSPSDHDAVPRRAFSMARRAAWSLIAAISGILAIAVVAGFLQPTGEVGALTETLYPDPSDVPMPVVSDVTGIWGVDAWKNSSRSQLGGGASLGNINGDGPNDLVIAGGTIGIFRNSGTRFNLVEGTNAALPANALSSAIADLDGDGLGDIVIGPEDGDVVVIWGGP